MTDNNYKLSLSRNLSVSALNLASTLLGYKCTFHSIDPTSSNIYSSADDNSEYMATPYLSAKKVVEGLLTDNQDDDIFGDPFFDAGVLLYDTQLHEKGVMVKIYMPKTADPVDDTIIHMVIGAVPKTVASGSIFIYKLSPLG